MKKAKKCAFGGSLGGDLQELAPLVSMIPGVGNIAGAAFNLIGGLLPDKKATTQNPMTYSPGNFAFGGEINQMANGMYQVNANSNKIDSVAVDYKGMPIKVDNKEVVDATNNFIYSNRLTNPQTGRTFAQDAAALARKKDKAENMTTKYGDSFAANTMKHLEQRLNDLRTSHEQIATSSGKRFTKGGPVVPPAELADNFYGKLNTGILDRKVQQQLSALGITTPLSGYDVNPNSINYRFPNFLDPRGNSNLVPQLPADTQAPVGYGDLITADPNADMTYGLADIQNAMADERMRIAPFLNGTPAAAQPSASSSVGMTASTFMPAQNRGATIGDILQVGSLINSFSRLRGGAEKEAVNYDTTPITRKVYDVNNALYANQSNYANAANTVDTASASLRRALQNSLYAKKLGADSQALSQYDQMNQGERVNYENRVSNQQRYNIGQLSYTNDINARNRAAYDEATQAAFGNLANFGVGLNRRKQQYDALDLYGSTYKDVYANILKTLGNG